MIEQLLNNDLAVALIAGLVYGCMGVAYTFAAKDDDEAWDPEKGKWPIALLGIAGFATGVAVMAWGGEIGSALFAGLAGVVAVVLDELRNAATKGVASYDESREEGDTISEALFEATGDAISKTDAQRITRELFGVYQEHGPPSEQGRQENIEGVREALEDEDVEGAADSTGVDAKETVRSATHEFYGEYDEDLVDGPIPEDAFEDPDGDGDSEGDDDEDKGSSDDEQDPDDEETQESDDGVIREGG